MATIGWLRLAGWAVDEGGAPMTYGCMHTPRGKEDEMTEIKCSIVVEDLCPDAETRAWWTDGRLRTLRDRTLAAISAACPGCDVTVDIVRGVSGAESLRIVSGPDDDELGTFDRAREAAGREWERMLQEDPDGE